MMVMASMISISPTPRSDRSSGDTDPDLSDFGEGDLLAIAVESHGKRDRGAGDPGRKQFQRRTAERELIKVVIRIASQIAGPEYGRRVGPVSDYVGFGGRSDDHHHRLALLGRQLLCVLEVLSQDR